MEYENENTGGRKREIILRLAVTENERDLIYEKMRLLHTNNFGAYARKILIDGYIIAVDHSDLKAIAAEMQKIGVNVGQIARRVNAANSFYEQDFEYLKRGIEEIPKPQRSRQDLKLSHRK